MNRREFLGSAGAGALSLSSATRLGASEVGSPGPPNILWVTCEDISPNLGCYGDAYAVTPNLDRLATQGVRYDRAFAPIGVCAPARSCLITGMYPPSLGTQHMRCKGTLPAEAKCFTEYLRQAGYYCSNNSKTDYNFKHPKSAWNACSRKAHWRGRKKGQPFFSVFNYTSCHESQIRLPERRYRQRTADFTDAERHDPARAPVPPYHPDTPEVRRDWARYADMITHMDKQVGKILKQLTDDGLENDTIVFFYSDHGAGMPRSKRWLYDSSLRVPMIIRCPAKYRHLAPGEPGSATGRMVSFVDFGPTALSLAGVPVPPHMHGKPFLGRHATPPRTCIYGFRDRMDERTDMLRCVRDARYKYIRNYMPHRPWFHEQYLDYMYQMPTMRVWQRLADEGKLSGPTATFMQRTKPPEELYDTQADPWEVRNLADDPKHRPALERMRRELRRWMTDIHDLGLLPEADLRARFGKTPPYEAVRRDPATYPQQRICAAADLASRMDPANCGKLISLMKDDDAAVRYWAVQGLIALRDKASVATEALLRALKDPSPDVRVAAAECLCRLGHDAEALPVLADGMGHDSEWVRLHAVNVLDRIDEQAKPVLAQMKRAARTPGKYCGRVLEHALEELER